jgi:hypothetical protein
MPYSLQLWYTSCVEKLGVASMCSWIGVGIHYDSYQLEQAFGFVASCHVSSPPSVVYN